MHGMESALVQTKPGYDELLYCLSFSTAALITQNGPGNQLIVKGKALNLADGDGIQGLCVLRLAGQFRFSELRREFQKQEK